MHATKMMLVTLLALAVAGGCKKDDKKDTDESEDTTDEPETEKPKEDPIDEPDEPDDDPEMTNKMVNCPAAVRGATTAVEKGDGVLVVTVTAEDEKAVAKIRERAKTLAEVSGSFEGTVEHTGKGTGGGHLGKCPILPGEATLEVEEVDGGVKVTATPKDAAKLDEMAESATARAEEMAAEDYEHGTGRGGGGGEEAGEGDDPGHAKGDEGGDDGE